MRVLAAILLKTMTPAEVEKWPDSVRLSDLEPRFVCKRCGVRGADVRPAFRQRGWVPPSVPKAERKAQPICDFFNSPLISD
jgi:hypothetical protein